MNDHNKTDNPNVMMSMMNKIMPTCQEVSHLTSSSMDADLTLRQKMGIRFHLLFCKYCQLFRKQMLQLKTIINSKSLSIEKNLTNPDYKLSSEFKAKLKNSLKENK